MSSSPYLTPKKFSRIVFFSFIGSFGMTYFTCTSCRSDLGWYVWISMFSVTLWLVLWAGNDWLTHYCNDKISWVNFPLRRLTVGILTTIVFTVSAVLAIHYLWKVFSPVRVGNEYYIVSFALIITFLISLFLHGREFLVRWRASAVEAERHQKESVKAQYESLKNQVNPHFLFNSLNALTNLVYEDQDKAAMFIKQLSEVYRYVLDTRDREVVPLKEELKFVESYLFLQKIRFGEKLRVNIDLDNASSFVAPLALQTLIENAIKHNVVSEESPLLLTLHSDGEYLIIGNAIRKKSNMESSTGLGLENIRKRYAFLTSKEVIVKDSNGQFVVKLPVIDEPI